MVRLALLAATLAACGGSRGTPSDAAPRADVIVLDGPFRDCRGRAYTPAPDEDFRHTASDVTVSLGDPNHSAQDVLVVPGAPRSLPGKFTYGTTSKDLEDEFVRVSLDDCAAWRDLGDHLTDGDGRIAVSAPAEFGPGVYEARFQVLGDQSTTTSFLWVLPAGTRVIVTDIDGTLTASDSELFMQILDGSHVPVAYPGAVDLTTSHADLGHIVVYLTGRPYWLTQRTRDWVRDLSFAVGPLHVTDSNEEAIPGNSGVGAFKLAWIQGLVAKGYVIDFAYGNATTDIHAYLGAGIPASNVWIIGENGGMDGTNAVVDSWEARVVEVRALPMVEQPFER